jgi:trimeric autotransporter adhesin
MGYFMNSNQVAFSFRSLIRSIFSTGAHASRLPFTALCLSICIAVFLASMGSFAMAAPGDITTVAGSPRGDGGLAINASLNGPNSIVIDRSGNTYILDVFNNVVRKVAASTGIITTFAGTGLAGYSGDGGAAIDATFNFPGDMVLDKLGNLYISDGARVRKISLMTGLINTVAGNGNNDFSTGDGGPATSASLRNYNPRLAVDESSNLYISDFGRIRKVTMATGIITTIVGTGLPGFAGDGDLAVYASISSSVCLAVDTAGNIYIGDAYNARIRKVTAATGNITTIAGKGEFGFSGDGGPAADATFGFPYSISLDADNNIYLTESNRVRKVTASSGFISTIAGTGSSGYSGDGGPATSASFSSLASVGIDAQRNVYIVDRGNATIRKLTVATGLISTVAGSGTANFAGDNSPAVFATLNRPQGSAVDAAGNLYIADTDNYRIRKVTASTGLITTIALGDIGFPKVSAAAKIVINRPPIIGLQIALDSAGNVYFARADRVLKVTVATGIITTVAGGEIPGFGGDGGLATNAKLSNPLAIAVDSLDNIYIADNFNSRVRKITAATGIITTVAGNGVSGYPFDGRPAVFSSLGRVFGIAVDSVGNIYLGDHDTHRIRKVTAATGIITTVAGTGVQGFSGDGGPATNANLDKPVGVAVDKLGNIFFSDSNARIRKITATTGAIATIAGAGVQGFSGDGGPATSAQIFGNNGVSLDNAGNLYIVDGNRIRKIAGSVADTVLRLGNDLSADGKSDLIFRNAATGQISAWLMNGTAATSTAGLVPPGNWTVTHAADFNGDGKADILYRNDDGAVTLWLMNGLTLASSAGLLGPNPDWRVSYVADFNGDGKTDILWRNVNGAVTLWLMDGTTVTSSVGLFGADPSWSVSHVADFNGDGKADLLWRSTNGAVTMWLMNGVSVASSAGLIGADPNWRVSHVADFNGDGKTDLLWRSSNGAVRTWRMDGITAVNEASLLGPDASWSVSHTGDFNGDGKGDILWRNTNGAVTLWLMNETFVSSAVGILGADPNWRVTHIGDYNGDGKSDLVWRNTSNGAITMWLMNGAATLNALGILGATTWSVVPSAPQ